jgi:hypothetical protein
MPYDPIPPVPSPARGILIGLVLSLPLWAVLGLCCAWLWR